MMFEWTLNVGTLLTILTIVFMTAGGYWRFEYTNKEVRSDIQDMKQDLKQLNKVIVDLALQSQRLDIMEKTLYELRHGKGIVREHHGDDISQRDF